MTTSNGKVYVFGSECFVRHPQYKGAWSRAHICIAIVDCPYCKAPRGTLCRNLDTGFAHGTTHAIRRNAAKHAQVDITVITGLQIADAETEAKE